MWAAGRLLADFSLTNMTGAEAAEAEMEAEKRGEDDGEELDCSARLDCSSPDEEAAAEAEAEAEEAEAEAEAEAEGGVNRLTASWMGRTSTR